VQWLPSLPGSRAGEKGGAVRCVAEGADPCLGGTMGLLLVLF